jgi:hypothetical protein
VAQKPTRPAYDNPTVDKGKLAAGAQPHIQEKPRQARRSDPPIGHRSDKKLGQKPTDH